MIPTTTRVEQHTDQSINEQIQRRTEQRLAAAGKQGEEDIDRRLEELDQEWDMERTLEVNRRFFMLPAVVAGFLLQHAVQGWCPPVPFFRRRGVRTAREIDVERYGLKALRGDFADLPGLDTVDEGNAKQVLKAMNR